MLMVLFQQRLCLIFYEIGVKVNYIIPNRFEHGYGLSTKIVDLIDEGLVITVDNGISAYDASLKLKEKY